MYIHYSSYINSS